MQSSLAVLYSGGLDSAILLAHLATQQRPIQPIYIDSSLAWQASEERAARRFLAALDSRWIAPLVVLSLPLADLYADHWSITGRGVPQADEADEQVYLPGRNPLLLVKADLWCRLHGVSQLAIGALATNPFADATDRFFQTFSAAMDEAAGGKVELVRPLGKLDKRQVMRLAEHAPLELTFSCLAPTGDLHCGTCNKCAERQHAFRDAGLADRTPYAAAARSITI